MAPWATGWAAGRLGGWAAGRGGWPGGWPGREGRAARFALQAARCLPRPRCSPRPANPPPTPNAIAARQHRQRHRGPRVIFGRCQQHVKVNLEHLRPTRDPVRLQVQVTQRACECQGVAEPRTRGRLSEGDGGQGGWPCGPPRTLPTHGHQACPFLPHVLIVSGGGDAWGARVILPATAKDGSGGGGGDGRGVEGHVTRSAWMASGKRWLFV